MQNTFKNLKRNRKDGNMSNSVYYKATDEDGNTVLRHGWKKHKYLYIKNGKYVYPEDLYKNAKQRVKNYFTSPGTDTKVSQKSYGNREALERQKALALIKKHKQWTAKHPPFVRDGKKEELERQKALALIKKHKQLAAKDSRVNSVGSPVNTAAIRKAKAQSIESYKRAQKAQHEKDLQKRVRAINAHTVAKKNADMVKKKQDRQMKKIAANVKKQNAPSTKINKAAKFVKKVATRDAAFKMAATKYLVDKAVNSPTANAAKSKARSVVSKAEYKIERAGQKLSDDVKSSGAYKSAKKGINSIPKNVNKAYKSVKSSIPTAAEVRNKANSVKSKAEYKLTRAGEKLTNDVKSSGAYKSAKKGINSISKNANKAYKSAKKEFNRISRDANKAYKSAKKKAKKVNRTFNKVKRAGKAYLDYLTK